MDADQLRALQTPLKERYREDADAEKLARLMKLTERYCVVYQTLKGAPPIVLGYAVGEGAS